MAKQNEVKKQPGKHVVIAVSKVIHNPKNSKAARTAAGLGLAHRRNKIFLKPGIQLNPNRDLQPAGLPPPDDNFRKRA